MTPRDELNGLLNEAIGMALNLSKEHGDHFPFCMAITTGAERLNFVADDRVVSGYDALFELVQNQVRESIANKQLRAVCVARHVTLRGGPVPPGTPASQITLDHIEDKASTCYLPFTISDGLPQPGQLFATEPVDSYFVKASPKCPEPKAKGGFLGRLFKK